MEIWKNLRKVTISIHVVLTLLMFAVTCTKNSSHHCNEGDYIFFTFFLASCAQIPLGLTSGMFPTLGFSALHSLTNEPRFQNGSNGWCSDQKNNSLEIDFLFLHKICALKLGGSNQVDRWILRYSMNGSDWLEYRQVHLIMSVKILSLPSLLKS